VVKAKKKVEPEKVAKKTDKVKVYCHFEKVAEKKARGYKVCDPPDDPRMRKTIGRSGGDLVCMEKPA